MMNGLWEPTVIKVTRAYIFNLFGVPAVVHRGVGPHAREELMGGCISQRRIGDCYACSCGAVVWDDRNTDGEV